MIFNNRTDAGQQLAAALTLKGLTDPIVLGIPRGGVPVAAEVARALGGELAVVVARKLGAPDYPELAIGATTETGASYINTAVAVSVGADERYIKAEKERQVQEAHRREVLFNSHRRPPVRGRTVIVVDDGVATGATAIAAIRSIKGEGAERVILAIPVGPPEMVELLRSEADEVVCLEEDPGFGAVGQYYFDFSQVSDEEVLRTLEAFPKKAKAGQAGPDPSQSVQIRRDGIRLAAVMTTPSAEGAFPLVIFVHGLGSGKDSPRNVVIAERLVDVGIATLLFDLSGHGESSADPSDGTEAFVADLQAALEWAVGQDVVSKDLIGIAGSSLGAVVAVRAVAEGRIRPKTMVLRAPPLEPAELQHVDIPSLVIVGSRDPLQEQVEEGVSLNSRLRLAIVDGASHLFEEPGTLDQALHQTVEWFRSQLRPTAAGGTGPASNRSTSRRT